MGAGEGLRNLAGRRPRQPRWKPSAPRSRRWCCWIWVCRRIPAIPKKAGRACPNCWRWTGLAKIVIITGQGEKEIALRAIGAGAYDFLSKPVEMEELKFLLKRCFHVAQLEQEYRQMQQLHGRRHL